MQEIFCKSYKYFSGGAGLSEIHIIGLIDANVIYPKVWEESNSGDRLLPASPLGRRQVAEQEIDAFLEGGLRFGLLAIAVVHFAGMAAQLLNGRGTQAGVGEGADEHIQQRNELGVGEGLLIVVAEPVIELDFPETQQGGFRVCGRVVRCFGRRRVDDGSLRGTVQRRQFFGGKA